MADCRCAACGCCKHDHRGWRHAWEPREIEMDGVFTECRSRHPVTGVQCVRIAGTHEEHRSQLAKDAYCQSWIDAEES